MDVKGWIMAGGVTGALLIAFVIGRSTLGSDGTEQALSGGFRTTGEILLITGIGGSLGAVIT